LGSGKTEDKIQALSHSEMVRKFKTTKGGIILTV
jgi:hypothetical protein